MTLRLNGAVLATCLLSACLMQRTENVPDPTLNQSDSAANGTTDAAGDATDSTGGQNGPNDANVIIACDGDDPCIRAELSLCDKESDTCKPCKVSRDCDDIAGKSACIKDVGCFECSDDNNTCGGASPVCHPTRHECVACSASNTAACDTNGKVCEPQSGSCVECLANTQCNDAAEAKCDVGKGECAKCTVNDDCKHIAGKPACNTATGACVACTTNAECTDPKASRCDASTNTCMGCGGPNDCTGIKDAVSGESLGLCANQECVECTRSAKTACGADVCNALTKRCADGVGAASADLCGACVSDDQCKTGQLCVHMFWDNDGDSVKETDVGWFCQWKVSGGGGAPSICSSSSRPFVSDGTGVPSVDDPSANANICTLATSTCPAHNTFRKICGRYGAGAGSFIVENVADPRLPNGATAAQIAPDDNECGLAGKCVVKNAANGAYKCSVRCGASNDDCPSGAFTCGGAPPGTPNICSAP